MPCCDSFNNQVKLQLSLDDFVLFRGIETGKLRYYEVKYKRLINICNILGIAILRIRQNTIKKVCKLKPDIIDVNIFIELIDMIDRH